MTILLVFERARRVLGLRDDERDPLVRVDDRAGDGRLARSDPHGVRERDVVLERVSELDDPHDDEEQDGQDERELDVRLTVVPACAAPRPM